MCYLCLRARCWWTTSNWTIGRRGKRKDDSDRSFRLRFSDTFPILICRDSRYGRTGATCCKRKGPTAYSILFLVGFIKDLGFRRIILKCDNEPSTKALQVAVIQACVGMEVIPQGPLEGEHMANGRVEMAVREVKRQCRTRISAEQNTSVRSADAAQVMNKMRIDKDGKTSKMRRTGRRWRQPMAQFGEKVWFREFGEDGVSSIASRMSQGIFVGHHDRTGAVLCVSKNRVVRGKSWTRETPSDAWESTNWEGLCGTPWQMVAPELTMKERDLHCQGLWLKEHQKLNPEDSSSCLRTAMLTDTHWRLPRMRSACIARRSDKAT